MERAVGRILKEDPLLSPSQARQAAPAKLKLVEQNARPQIQALIENQIGVVSFAGCQDDLLMWAHYADSHRGVVIEFDANKLVGQILWRSADFFGEANRVQYSELWPTINFYTETSWQQVNKLLLTKSIHWKYEQEWRIVVKDRRLSPKLQFAPEFMTAIYLGCRISDCDRKAILNCVAARAPTVPVFDSKPSANKYGLEFVPISQ
jgi:Protein of unknown function (DUF2971)